MHIDAVVSFIPNFFLFTCIVNYYLSKVLFLFLERECKGVSFNFPPSGYGDSASAFTFLHFLRLNSRVYNFFLPV